MSFPKGPTVTAEAAGVVSVWRQKLMGIRKEVDELLELLGSANGLGILQLGSATGVGVLQLGSENGSDPRDGPRLFEGPSSSGLKLGGMEASTGLSGALVVTDGGAVHPIVSVELGGMEGHVAPEFKSSAPSVVVGDLPETLPAPEYSSDNGRALADGLSGVIELGGREGNSSAPSVVDGDCPEASQTPELSPEFSPEGTFEGQLPSGAMVVHAGGGGHAGGDGHDGPISAGFAGPWAGGGAGHEGALVVAGHDGLGSAGPISGPLLGGQEEGALVVAGHDGLGSAGPISVPSNVMKGESPAWVLDMVSSVGNMVGLSCGGHEDKLRDLFAALERDRVQPCSKKSRKSKGKMIRELQGLKSSVNYDGAPSIDRNT